MRTLLMFCICFSIYSIASAQRGWKPLETIYDDGSLKVELQYRPPRGNPCQAGSVPFKYRYRVTGSYRNRPTYLNWKMDYIDCNGNLYSRQSALEIGKSTYDDIRSGAFVENFDDRFTAQRIDKKFYDVQVGNSPLRGSKLIGVPNSKDPTGIRGPNDIYMNEVIELEVEGGQLGIGASWIWYSSQCGGTRIGSGKRIKLKLLDQAIIFVRAEGTNNTTQCVQKRINVDKRSRAPLSISGNKELCRGDNNTLTVAGGSLGEGAKWVWYEGGCGGKRVGVGPSINVAPKDNTTYYVRAEGKLNKTKCVSLKTRVNERSTDPTKIVPNGGSTICEGEKLKLSVQGGDLSSDADWVWYTGACGSRQIGKGNYIYVSPSLSTTYYVRGEGVCNNTDCKSVDIQVKQKSRKADLISISETEVFRGQKTTLSVSGGYLAPDAEWEWFKNQCGRGLRIGRGSTNVVKPTRTSTYYVRARGGCNETPCTSISITPRKRRSLSHLYNRDNKLIHFGLGVGLEGFEFTTDLPYSHVLNPEGNWDQTTIYGTGIVGDLAFYPVMREYLSFGLKGNYAIGTSPFIVTGGKRTDIGSQGGETERYFYSRLNLGLELSFGVRPFKFLTQVRRDMANHNFEQLSSGRVFNAFKEQINRTDINLGIRFGRYRTKSLFKRRSNLDIYYSLSKVTPDGLLNLGLTDFDMSKMSPGFGISWWRQSLMKIDLKMIVPQTSENFDIVSADYNRAFFQVSLIYNRNWFY